MQFATTAQRDAAFKRLLDRGAAVRAVDTGEGPALIVVGSAAAFSSEFNNATQVSLDATVRVTSDWTPARDRSVRSQVSYQEYEPGEVDGMSVAIIDSGIQLHPDLPRVRKFKDFVSGSLVPVDGCGHGTHVAGIVAGDGRMSDGAYAGIAPGVGIVALRVLDNNCSGKTSDVIDALDWVGNNYLRYKIRVVNLSLGHAVLESIFTDPLVRAVERLSRKGIVVVTAAGNKGINPKTGKPGYGGVGVPCNAPSSICVGSLDTKGTPDLKDDSVAPTSSRGPTRFDLLAKPDLVAPGVNIISLSAPGSRLFTTYPALQVLGIDGKPRYFNLSGTSMASPAVAGAASLVLGANPGLTANTVKMILQFTARLIKKTDVLTQGAGALNLKGALTLAKAINSNAPVGTNWIRKRLTASNSDAYGNVIKWSRRIIYGDRFMKPRYAEIRLVRWSDHLVWGYDAIADNIVWGNDDNIVWGNNDNIVWGNSDNIVWGNNDNIVWGNYEDDNIVWGNDESDNIVWGIDDNIVWGNGYLRDVWASNVIWGFWDDNIVWGNITRATEDNIVWGNADDNIVWGNCAAATVDNIVWGNDDNIVWGNCSAVKGADDNIVWGNSVLTGGRR